MNAEAKLAAIKKWYVLHYPLCLFCGHVVYEGDLAHIVRRSYSSELLTLKLNTGLAHRDCHELYDNKPRQAQYLPRMPEVLFIAWLICPDYFYMIADKFPRLNPFFERFPEAEAGKIEHHGEILSLQYLIQ
jgi:hypothetical protein